MFYKSQIVFLFLFLTYLNNCSVGSGNKNGYFDALLLAIASFLLLVVLIKSTALTRFILQKG